MLTSFKRITTIGVKNFWRNPTLSFATIFIMTMVVFLFSILFIFNKMAGQVISGIQDKVDIAVYFNKDANREDEIALKAKIGDIAEVKSVDYVSKDDALKIFTETHKDDPALMESLAEVGDNPLLDSLTIRVKEATDYEKVSNSINSIVADSTIVKNVDYFERKPMIDKALGIAGGIRTGVLGITITLAVIAIFIAFNAIKIAIFNSRDEVSVMRLVGASNLFIRGPFLVEGILIGLLSAMIAIVFTFGLSYGFNGQIKSFAPSISTFRIYMENFWLLLLIQLFSGTLLGAFSSSIAIRKHLKV